MTRLRLSLALARGASSLALEASLCWHGIVGLSGVSGAGKTTLLRILAGLEPQASGRIVLDGVTLLDTARSINVPAHRRRIGMIFQDGRLLPHLSVEGNLRYACARSKGRAGPQWHDVVPALRLAPLLTRRPDSLSGGETQRVAIARALLGSPGLLLLDEPVSALDRVMRDEVLDAIETVRDRFALPMLYASHADEELSRLARTQLRIGDGRLLNVPTASRDDKEVLPT